jgi:hypothetical protein
MESNAGSGLPENPSPLPPMFFHPLRILLNGDDLVGRLVLPPGTVGEADELLSVINLALNELNRLGKVPMCIRKRKVNRAFELVCVELNPGPTIQLVSSQTNRKKKKTKVGNKAKKTKQVQKQSTALVPMGQKSLVQTRFSPTLYGEARDANFYKRCLMFPFDATPVRLGGECMMPTGTATLTLRSVVTPGVASFSMVIWPWAITQNYISITAAAPYAYTAGGLGLAAAYPSGASLNTIANGGRVIAAGVRVTSIAAATNDNGVITVGCLPRESTSDPFVAGGITAGGFPLTPTVVSTQGFNEFLNYLQTESYPVRCGASAFYRPQDPLDFEFRLVPDIIGSTNLLLANTPLTPFFVIGVQGASTTGSYIVEQILHLEYTVADGTVGVVNTGMGNISSQGLINAAKQVFGQVVDSTIMGVTGGFTKGLAMAADAGISYALGKSPFRGKGSSLGAFSGAQFSSSDYIGFG